jgi:hypothetical protein
MTQSNKNKPIDSIELGGDRRSRTPIEDAIERQNQISLKQNA